MGRTTATDPHLLGALDNVLRWVQDVEWLRRWRCDHIAKGDKLKYVMQIHFDSSNNKAEYEALLYRLRMAISLGVRRLMVYGDSDLVVNQVMKEWDVRNPTMTTYCNAVRSSRRSLKV